VNGNPLVIGGGGREEGKAIKTKGAEGKRRDCVAPAFSLKGQFQKS